MVSLIWKEVHDMEEKKMTLRLPLEIHQKLSIAAKEQQRSIHNLILVILTEYLSEKN